MNHTSLEVTQSFVTPPNEKTTQFALDEMNRVLAKIQPEICRYMDQDSLSWGGVFSSHDKPFFTAQLLPEKSTPTTMVYRWDLAFSPKIEHILASEGADRVAQLQANPHPRLPKLMESARAALVKAAGVEDFMNAKAKAREENARQAPKDATTSALYNLALQAFLLQAPKNNIEIAAIYLPTTQFYLDMDQAFKAAKKNSLTPEFLGWIDRVDAPIKPYKANAHI